MKVKYIGEGKGIFLYNKDFKPGVEVEVADDLEFDSSVFEVSKKVETKESKPTESSLKPKSKKKSK